MWLSASYPFQKVRIRPPLQRSCSLTPAGRCQKRHRHRRVPAVQTNIAPQGDHKHPPPSQAFHDNSRYHSVPRSILSSRFVWPRSTHIRLSRTSCDLMDPNQLVSHVRWIPGSLLVSTCSPSKVSCTSACTRYPQPCTNSRSHFCTPQHAPRRHFTREIWNCCFC